MLQGRKSRLSAATRGASPAASCEPRCAESGPGSFAAGERESAKALPQVTSSSTQGGAASQLHAANGRQLRAAVLRKASVGTGLAPTSTATAPPASPGHVKPAAPKTVIATAATPAHSGATTVTQVWLAQTPTLDSYLTSNPVLSLTLTLIQTVTQVLSTSDGPAAEQDSAGTRAAPASCDSGAGARCARDWTAAEVAARKADPWQSVDPLTRLTRVAFLALSRFERRPGGHHCLPISPHCLAWSPVYALLANAGRRHFPVLR